jgi:prepilin-type N-terminal cleavage/methylation domain-containing protein
MGFTLIEVLVTITIMSILAVLSVTAYVTLQTSNDLDAAKNDVVQSLRRAQTLAQSSDGDTNWGVGVRSTTITLFKGTSYASRTVAFDEIFAMPTTITVSGVTDVVYAKFTGLPQSTGTITLTASNKVVTINVNDKGTLTY